MRNEKKVNEPRDIIQGFVILGIFANFILLVLSMIGIFASNLTWLFSAISGVLVALLFLMDLSKKKRKK